MTQWMEVAVEKQITSLLGPLLLNEGKNFYEAGNECYSPNAPGFWLMAYDTLDPCWEC